MALIALKIECCKTFLSEFVCESFQETLINEGFCFLVGIFFFCGSTMCSKALHPLLSYVTESSPQLCVQPNKQTRICSLFTMLSISSLLSAGPWEISGGLSVGYADMYFHLHFLRTLNGFDVFIKNHSCETDICTFILDCD